MNNMVVYITINCVNGKRYIGKDASDRGYYFGSGTYIKKAIKKYGKENFIKVISIDKNGIKTKFNSLKEAQEKTGISFKNISQNLRGINKSAGGYKWKYLNVA